MNEARKTNESETVMGYSTSTGVILYGGFGLIGLVIGFFLPRIAGWAIDLPFLPFQGPIKLIDYLNHGVWLTVVLMLLGAIAGCVVAYIAIQESLVVKITDQHVQLLKDGHKPAIALQQEIAREAIEHVFLDGKQLVILGKSGHELVRAKSDEPIKALERDWADAFKKHGYPWNSEGDPYQAEYRRWVLDTPDLPAAANAVFKAREIALRKKEQVDIKDLRQELAKLGYVIRDEETRQYWRHVQTE